MPDFFDKYQLIKRIAHGGIAEVFLARQVGDVAGFSKQVAIKRMFPHLIDREDIISMFIDEARIVSNLNHPAIVQTFDLGVIDGSFYIAMEYVDGLDLRRVCEVGIENNAFIPAEIAVQIIIEAASGLHYAHTRVDANGQPMGIVHRDISPQNILISRQGAVKICDFGIAKAEHRLTTTRSGEFKGKFGYMSPEQAGGLPIDLRSDIFSLGILLYEITAGTRLFRAITEYETIKLVVNAVVEPPSQFIPNFPRDLEAIILKALDREPSKRYQTAEALQIALEDWLFTHRQRVGSAQIARYMELLLSKIPGDSENQQLPSMQTAPTPLSQTTQTAAQPVHAPLTPRPTLPKAGLSSLAKSSPDTGLRLPVHNPLPVQSPVQTTTTSITATASADQEDDRTRPFSIPQSAIHQADSSAASNQPALLNHLPKPAMNLPKPSTPPQALAARQPLQPSVQHAEPNPVPSSNVPIQQAQSPPAATKTWNVEPPGEESFDTDWARSHRRKKLLLTTALGMVFVAVSALGIWFFTQPGQPNSDPSGLAGHNENNENSPLTAYRGPLLDHATSSVFIDSVPPGAHIVVNGKLTGQQTPADVTLYRDVLNEITLYSQGFLPHALQLTPSEQTAPQSAELTPRTPPVAAKLQINSNPPGGSVLLNGEVIGTTPLSLDNIASNFEHHVQISMPDHHAFAGFIHILEGIDNTINAVLAPLDQPSRKAFVELAYESLPRGSQVWVDTEMLGISPFFSNHNRDSLLQIELKAAGHQQIRRVVATSDIGMFLLRPYLAPIKRESGQISLNIRPTPANIYIGSSAYTPKQLRNIELLEGEYDAVFETNEGTRIRTKIQVHPNKKTAYNVQLTDDQAEITAQR